MSNVSYQSLTAYTVPWRRPTSLPVALKEASCLAATSSASGMSGLLSSASVMLRALCASIPNATRFAGRRLTVIIELIAPACLIVVNGPSGPSGWFTHGPSYALMRWRYICTTCVEVRWPFRISTWIPSIVASSIWNLEGFDAALSVGGSTARIASAALSREVAFIGTPLRARYLERDPHTKLPGSRNVSVAGVGLRRAERRVRDRRVVTAVVGSIEDVEHLGEELDLQCVVDLDVARQAQVDLMEREADERVARPRRARRDQRVAFPPIEHGGRDDDRRADVQAVGARLAERAARARGVVVRSRAVEVRRRQREVERQVDDTVRTERV